MQRRRSDSWRGAGPRRLSAPRLSTRQRASDEEESRRSLGTAREEVGARGERRQDELRRLLRRIERDAGRRQRARYTTRRTGAALSFSTLMQLARSFVDVAGGSSGSVMLVRRVVVRRRLRDNGGRHAMVPRPAGEHGRCGQPLQGQRHGNQPHYCGSEDSPHGKQCRAIDSPYTMSGKALLQAPGG